LIRLILLIVVSILDATTIEFSNLKVTNIYKSKVTYQLTAQKHIESFNKRDSLKFFFNRQKYMLEHNYYLNGIFQTSKAKIYYKKAYILGKVYLFDTNGTIDNKKIKAKEIIFDNKSYILKNCEIITPKRVYRRKRFMITGSR